VGRPAAAPLRIAPENDEVLNWVRALDCISEDGLLGTGRVEQCGVCEFPQALELWAY
jgi:hypothetical protein